MTSEETITLTRREYDALIERNSQLEDMLAAQDADDGVRVPHEVALDIMRGKGPILAFRNHQGITLRELSEKNRYRRRVHLRDRAWAKTGIDLGLGPHRQCAWHGRSTSW